MKKVTLDEILKLEELGLQLPQKEMKVFEDFIDGVYARTIHIPADTFFIGKVHSKENFLIVRAGVVEMTIGDELSPLLIGQLITSPAGEKRMGYAYTDCLLTTFHHNPTNEKDPIKLLDLYSLPNSSLLGYDSSLRITGN